MCLRVCCSLDSLAGFFFLFFFCSRGQVRSHHKKTALACYSWMISFLSEEKFGQKKQQSSILK